MRPPPILLPAPSARTGNRTFSWSKASFSERLIWLEASAVNKLRAVRGKGESYSDVILRLAAVGHESLNAP
jgi:hypothetical protein